MSANFHMCVIPIDIELNRLIYGMYHLLCCVFLILLVSASKIH
jgi:hypothetical protein